MTPLFSDFEPTSTEAWEAAIEKALKGKPYDETLLWKATDDLTLRPYYRKEDLHDQLTVPGKADGNTWIIFHALTVEDAASGNKSILNALNHGAAGIILSGKLVDFDALLKDVSISHIALQLDFDDNLTACKALQTYCTSNQIEFNNLHVSFGCDPIGKLFAAGNWASSQEEDFANANALLKLLEASNKAKGIHIQADHFHNAGGSVVQQLAFALAQGVEYLDNLTNKGWKIDALLPKMQFTFAAGTSYFVEMAKFRTFRVLWEKIAQAYGAKMPCEIHIHGTNSEWQLSGIDPNSNMLRLTSEAMSAVLGGANSFHALPFDAATKAGASEHAERVAIHLQHILSDEAGLSRINDPAAGAYYIEKLTSELAQKAWALFQKVEAQGGLLAVSKSGWMQNQIKKEADQTKENYKNGALVMIGGNKYFNPKDKFEGAREEAAAPKETVVQPLDFTRLTSISEQEATLKTPSNAS